MRYMYVTTHASNISCKRPITYSKYLTTQRSNHQIVDHLQHFLLCRMCHPSMFTKLCHINQVMPRSSSHNYHFMIRVTWFNIDHIHARMIPHLVNRNTNFKKLLNLLISVNIQSKKLNEFCSFKFRLRLFIHYMVTKEISILFLKLTPTPYKKITLDISQTYVYNHL